MALLDPEPGTLRPRTTGGPAGDRVPDDRASGTPETLRKDLVRLLGERKVLHSAPARPWDASMPRWPGTAV
ncbi:hypothetical protein AQI95_23040 [Streptomyces yokosukanensis]|uniref:Uncharacterized protein n=1 Tax=Streptomyces yokosukanensis TaxID=67386 RepID=A0A117Q147_9ACTN|nr:hypothetical protein AQI95_23040 [Streptomyces yokosukanensis]